MLERKLGIKNDEKRKQRVNQQIESIGFGKGFMSFIDSIGTKVKSNSKSYRPQEYEFSDGEGPEEGDLEALEEKGQEDASDQEGFGSLEEEGDVVDIQNPLLWNEKGKAKSGQKSKSI